MQTKQISGQRPQHIFSKHVHKAHPNGLPASQILHYSWQVSDR